MSWIFCLHWKMFTQGCKLCSLGIQLIKSMVTSPSRTKIASKIFVFGFHCTIEHNGRKYCLFLCTNFLLFGPAKVFGCATSNMDPVFLWRHVKQVGVNQFALNCCFSPIYITRVNLVHVGPNSFGGLWPYVKTGFNVFTHLAKSFRCLDK